MPEKGIEMFTKVKIPVLGIVENMAVHICSNCGHEDSIFGTGGGETVAEQYGTELLGSLPLDRSIRERGDQGVPSVAAEPEGKIAQSYREIARKVLEQLASEGSDSGPEIVFE